MMKFKTICICVLTCFILNIEANARNGNKAKGKPKITKCKDEKGVWHYGSSNLYRCADSSNITTYNERGVKVKQVDKVKTQQELVTEEKKKEQMRLKEEKIKLDQLEKSRILTVYQSEADIESARQEKMTSYDRKINQHKNYIEALGNREKSLESKKTKTTNGNLKKKYTKEIKTLAPKAESSREKIIVLRKEKLEAIEKFDNDLAIFRKYKS